MGNPGDVYTHFNGHDEPNSVAFAERFCDNASNVVDLAELMIHEADHYCAAKTGQKVGEDEANNAARECRKQGGE